MTDSERLNRRQRTAKNKQIKEREGSDEDEDTVGKGKGAKARTESTRGTKDSLKKAK